jgi:hypothetical protein
MDIVRSAEGMNASFKLDNSFSNIKIVSHDLAHTSFRNRTKAYVRAQDEAMLSKEV